VPMLEILKAKHTHVTCSLVILMMLAAVPSLSAATITVNTNVDATADDGVCTLREAIVAANTNAPSGATAGECSAGSAGLDTIAFGIGTGSKALLPLSAYPNITELVVIDGFTQPGGSLANTSPSADNS